MEAIGFCNAPTSIETPEPNVTSTASPTITPTVSQTLVANYTVEVRNLSGNEIGNGHLRVFHPETVEFPTTITIELELIFDNYYVTPTPFGQRTQIPAATASNSTTNYQTPVPRIPQRETSPGSVEIYEIIGASLRCHPSSFSRCDDNPNDNNLKPITLAGVNWTWIISPNDDIDGPQDLFIELWRPITINNGPERTQVIETLNFQIVVQAKKDRLFDELLAENFGAVIAACSSIIVALISGGYLITKKHNTVAKLSSVDKPKVFISYRRGSSAGFAHTIHDMLEAKGAEVFIDIDDIHAGSFSNYIQEHIMKSDYFIVILTPDTLQSEWVIKEIKYAHKHKKTIIPVLLNNFDLYGSTVTKDVKFLQHQQAVTLLPQYVDAAVALISKYIGLESTK